MDLPMLLGTLFAQDPDRARGIGFVILLGEPGGSATTSRQGAQFSVPW
jgi:hypothetical protein